MIADEIASALVTALELGLPAFPCRPDKAPACPRGFRAAVSDPRALRELWRCYPGPLVGVPTGPQSDLDTLDIDAPRHTEAAAWWQEIGRQLPPTRIHRTRSGGLHVLFRHEPGLRCWAGRPLSGIDGRADGGYIIWWPAAGLGLISDAPPAPWPEWLIHELEPKHAPVPGQVWEPQAGHSVSRYVEAALRNAAFRIQGSPIGFRNNALNAEAYGLGRMVIAGLLDAQTVADSLAAAATAAGLPPREIEATLRSAFAARGLL
jgi:hypothetical protein